MKEGAGNIAAAILAGGRNSRMGGFNKAFIQINGIPVIETALAVLKRTFTEIIIVTNSPRDFKIYEKEAIITGDLIKDAGPLAGMHAAFSRTSKEAVFFTACDMPFLHNALIRRMARSFNETGLEALVPRIGSSLEPLYAIYKTAIKEKLAAYLSGIDSAARTGFCRDRFETCPYRYSKDRSVKGFLEVINTRYLDLDNEPEYRRIFKNLNTPQDLRDAGGYFADKIKSLA
ncbi:MAG: molybdenum cofactor guanylyltransferase [Candidatus Omnitrophota bacterium]|nr:molybdenum cofactor guanylyltransferase [Candidatus Omnitrophota bacterium]